MPGPLVSVNFRHCRILTVAAFNMSKSRPWQVFKLTSVMVMQDVKEVWTCDYSKRIIDSSRNLPLPSNHNRTYNAKIFQAFTPATLTWLYLLVGASYPRHHA